MDVRGQRDDQLIGQLKQAMKTGVYPAHEYSWRAPVVSPPVSHAEIAEAEARLGFALSPFLPRLYCEVGNGGFGPGYGLFPLDSGSSDLDSIVTAYAAMRAMTQQEIDENWADEDDKPSLWPARILMVCDWGCNIYSLVNCSSSDLQVLRMDSNASVSEWAVESPSVQEWLATWLAGEPLFHLHWERAEKVAVAHLSRSAE